MAEIVYQTVFQFKRGTAEALDRANPILKQGEPGYEVDKKRLKIGDGISNWKSLEYFGGDFSISADEKSITFSGNNLEIYGFSSALPGQFPRKDKSGVIVWVDSVSPPATEDTPGAVRLYDSLGEGTDGTLTQKVITDKLNSKVGIKLDASDNEMIVFI